MSTTHTAAGPQSHASATSPVSNTGSAKDDARQDVRESYADLQRDVSNLTEAVTKLANSEFGGAIGEAQQAAEQGLSSVEQSIRKHPTQAALVAAGIGFLAGLLIIR